MAIEVQGETVDVNVQLTPRSTELRINEEATVYGMLDEHIALEFTLSSIIPHVGLYPHLTLEPATDLFPRG